MRKLLLTIGMIGALTACEKESTNELIETSDKKVNCFFALVSNGKLVNVFNHSNNIIGIDGYKNAINEKDQHHYYCFDVSKYSTEEMIEIIKEKY